MLSGGFFGRTLRMTRGMSGEGRKPGGLRCGEDSQNDRSRCHAERSLRSEVPWGGGILREDPQNDTWDVGRRAQTWRFTLRGGPSE